MTGCVPEVEPDVESWTRGIAWTEVDENPLDAKVPVPYRVPPVAKIPTPRIATMNSQTGIPLFEAVKRMINRSFHAFPCYSLNVQLFDVAKYAKSSTFILPTFV